MLTKKYVLTGLYNKPCTQGGVKTIPAEGNRPEQKLVEQVLFKPGEVTETDLDMSAAERAGFIRCVGDVEKDAKPAAEVPAEKPVKIDPALTKAEEEAKATKEAEEKAAEEKAAAEAKEAEEKKAAEAKEAEEKEAAEAKEAEEKAAEAKEAEEKEAAEAEAKASKKKTSGKKKATKKKTK